MILFFIGNHNERGDNLIKSAFYSICATGFDVIYVSRALMSPDISTHTG